MNLPARSRRGIKTLEALHVNYVKYVIYVIQSKTVVNYIFKVANLKRVCIISLVAFVYAINYNLNLILHSS